MEAYIKRDRANLVLMPMEDVWKEFVESLPMFTDEFMESRKQLLQKKRGELFDCSSCLTRTIALT